MKFLEERKEHLYGDCLKMERAPVRVLDCKMKMQRGGKTPLITDNLRPKAAAHYAEERLNRVRLTTEDPKMVRYLDYYTGTVFEFTTSIRTQQNTFLPAAL